MNTPTIVLAILVAVVGANPRPDRSVGMPPGDPEATPVDPPGYGYGHGYGPHAYNYYYQPPPPPPKEPRLTLLDKFLYRMEKVLDQLKTVEEEMKAIESRMSIHKKRIDELLRVTIPDLEQTDTEQDRLITNLLILGGTILSEISSFALEIDSLESRIGSLTHDQANVESLLMTERLIDVQHESDVQRLLSDVVDFKKKLFQVTENRLAEKACALELLRDVLEDFKTVEKRRMCEPGKVTLTRKDRRAEYSYQNMYANVPQVLGGTCGESHDLDVRPPAPPSGYGYSHQNKEPNALGYRVNAYSSKTTLTAELFELGFGDTKTDSVDYCFMVCRIGPGISFSGIGGLQALVNQTDPADQTSLFGTFFRESS